MYKFTNLKQSRFEKVQWMHKLALFDHCFIAGGALRTVLDLTDVIADYDIFFTDITKVDIVRELLLAAGATLTFACPKGELFTYKLNIPEEIIIQLICRKAYVNIIECVNSFDINAGRFAYDGKTFYTDRFAIKDVRTKVLTLFSVNYPAATLGRIYKYALKGYKHYQARLDFVNLVVVAKREFNLEDLSLYSID